MNFSTIRIVGTYHLIFLVVAVFAFYAYYQTLDVQTASAIASTTADGAQGATQMWLDDKHSWYQRNLAPIFALPGQIRSGMGR